MAPRSAGFNHNDPISSGLRLYTRAVYTSEDILSEASRLDSTANEEEILRYEGAAQRFLSGQIPYLLTAALKGPFDKASGWINPWDTTVPFESQPTTQQPTPKVIPETQAATCCPSTVLSTPYKNPSSHLPKSACHLPSPESLVNHPFLEWDAVARVQTWRDSVLTTKAPAREEFWVPRPRGTSKRRSVDGSWLKKREGKRLRISGSESESPCLSVGGTYGAVTSSKLVAPEASQSTPSSSSSAAATASPRSNSTARRQSVEVLVSSANSTYLQSGTRSTHAVARDSSQPTEGNMPSVQLASFATVSSLDDLTRGTTPRIPIAGVASRTTFSSQLPTTRTQTIASPNARAGQRTSQPRSQVLAGSTHPGEDISSESEPGADGSAVAKAEPAEPRRCSPGLMGTCPVPEADSCQRITTRDEAGMQPQVSEFSRNHEGSPAVADPGALSSAPASTAFSASSSSNSSEPRLADVSANTSLEEDFIGMPKRSEVAPGNQHEVSGSNQRANLDESTAAAGEGPAVSSKSGENQPQNPIPPPASPRNTNLDRSSPPAVVNKKKSPESTHTHDHEGSRLDNENASCAVAMVTPILASAEPEAGSLTPIRLPNHELLDVSPSDSLLRHEVGDVTPSSLRGAENPGGRLATQNQTPWTNHTVGPIVATAVRELALSPLQPTMGNSQAKTEDTTQSPWAKEDKFIPQLSSPIAIAPVLSPRLPPAAVEGFFDEEFGRAIQAHTALPSDASNTSFSLPSFSTFMTPPRKRGFAGALRSGGRLPETPSLLEAAAENPWESNRRPKKRVSWARLPHEGDGATVGSSPSSCPSRFTTSSPPPAAPIPDGYEDTEEAFRNHFVRVKRRTNPVRQRLLPPASQQYQSSQGIDAMAQAFMAADSVLTEARSAHPTNGDKAKEGNTATGQTGDEDPVDDVEAVLGNLDQFINPWEVEKDLEKSRARSRLSGAT